MHTYSIKIHINTFHIYLICIFVYILPSSYNDPYFSAFHIFPSCPRARSQLLRPFLGKRSHVLRMKHPSHPPASPRWRAPKTICSTSWCQKRCVFFGKELNYQLLLQNFWAGAPADFVGWNCLNWVTKGLSFCYRHWLNSKRTTNITYTQHVII